MAGTRIGFGRHALTPASSPSAPRRPGGSLPTRSWWPSTAGSAAVRTRPAGYRGHVEGLGPPLEGISGGHRVPNAFARVGREKVRAPWGPRVPSVLGGGIKLPVPPSASPKCPRHCRVPCVAIRGGDTKIPMPWPTAPCSVISRPHTSPSLCYGPAVPTALYSPCHGPTVPPSPVLRLDPKSPHPHGVSPFTVTNGQLQQLSQTSETSSSISSYSSGPPPPAVNGLGTATPGPPARTVDVAISTEDGPRRGWARERAERAMQTEPATEGLAETRRTMRPPELLRDTAIRGQGAREPPGTHPRRTFGHSPKTALLLALSRPRQPITRSQSDLTVAGRHWGAAPPPWGSPPLGAPPNPLNSPLSARRGEAEEGEAGGPGGAGGPPRFAPLQDPRQPLLQGRPCHQPELGPPEPGPPRLRAPGARQVPGAPRWGQRYREGGRGTGLAQIPPYRAPQRGGAWKGGVPVCTFWSSPCVLTPLHLPCSRRCAEVCHPEPEAG